MGVCLLKKMAFPKDYVPHLTYGHLHHCGAPMLYMAAFPPPSCVVQLYIMAHTVVMSDLGTNFSEEQGIKLVSWFRKRYVCFDIGCDV